MEFHYFICKGNCSSDFLQTFENFSTFFDFFLPEKAIISIVSPHHQISQIPLFYCHSSQQGAISYQTLVVCTKNLEIVFFMRTFASEKKSFTLITFTTMNKRLTKSSDKMIAGVCGGIAEYFDVDPTLVRAGYALLSVFSAGFPGLLLYIILCIVMPNSNSGYIH